MKQQSLLEIYKITEWRDGAIYRTKSVGIAWVTSGYKFELPLQATAISTKLMKSLKYMTTRTVKDDVPDIVMVNPTEQSNPRIIYSWGIRTS